MKELHELLTWLKDWLALLTPIGTGIILFWKYWLKRRLDDAKDLYNRIKVISDEFRPNGGSTLRDAINRIEQKLTAQNQKIMAVIKSLPAGTWISDENGKTIDLNKSLCRILGRTESEIRGDNWQNWLHPDDKEDVIEEWMRCVTNVIDFDMTYKFILPTGKIQKVHGVAYQLRDDGGKLIGFLGTLYVIGDPE